ncbi:MAG: InlB B-repeat-containing protein, partial [Clostridia bacterium]|nr:InlB B-repeat-containing protein [Clostridia bacterium]
MKQKLRKPVAWLLTFAMLFTMLPGVTLTASAANAAPFNYIASIAVAYGNKESTPKDILSDQGYTIMNYDLNADAGGHYIYMGYKTTTDCTKAITGVLFRYGENPPESITYKDAKFYLLGGSTEPNPGENTHVDLNADAGGAYIYTYVTRDTNFGAPITGFDIIGANGIQSFGKIYPDDDGHTWYNPCCETGGNEADLNCGTNDTAIRMYSYYLRKEITCSASYIGEGGNRLVSNKKEYVNSDQQRVYWYDMKDLSTVFLGTAGLFGKLVGWREDDTAAAPTLTDSPSVNYYTDGKLYRAVYTCDLTLTYDANGGSGAPAKQAVTQYYNAGSSVITSSTPTVKLSTTVPTHSGKCIFLGWSTDPDADSASYTAGGSISVGANTTLYAIYQQEHSYINGECVCGANIHSYDAKGFCACTAGETHYQPAVLNSDGYYQIGNAGQLFWFANYINTVDRTANAILTADIDLENRSWTPIGATGENSNNFRGHFDGDGHTIKGLYVEGERAGLGFFGEVRTGTVENFAIYGNVVVNTEVDYVGGVIGSACGLNSSDHGLERNGATIRNITSYVNLTAKAHGVGKIGGFVGYANHQSLIENCAWYGTFDAGEYRVDSGAGGFIGKIQENTSEVTIRNCGAYGAIKTNYAKNSYNNNATIYMGGFLSFSNTDAKTTLENCLFAGRFERGENLTDQAFLGAFGTLRSVNAIKNCYYLGDDGLLAQHSDSPLKAGEDANVGITTVTAEQLKSGEVANKLGSAWGQDIGEDAYPVLDGETVYLVKNCKDEDAYSNTNADIDHMVVNGTCTVCGTVFCDHSGNENKYDCTEGLICSVCNTILTAAGGAHVFDENGFCTNCGGYEPAVLNSDGYYEISNAGQLYWFAAQVNGGNKAINGKLMENITVNENVLDANGGLNSGSFRVWTPIGGSSGSYAGTFDGANHTVSGLYFNNSKTRFVGLFGFVNVGTVKNVGIIDSYLCGSDYVGGVVGEIIGTITNCYNTGSIMGTYNFVGGIVGWNFSSSTVTNCYNTGAVTGNGNRVGGVAGGNSATITNCYNIGAVTGSDYVGGIVGWDNEGTVTNSYYLSGCARDGENTVQFGIGNAIVGSTTADMEGSATAKTAAQFASGEVAYLLNGDQTEIVFKQTIGEDAYPYFTGETVYAVTGCDGTGITGYSNTADEKAGHTPGEDDGDCTTAVSCTVCGTAVVAAKEHAFDSDGKCTNDGCTAIGYDLWVGGEQFTSVKLTISGTTGTATYDPGTNTLTLNNYTYEGAGHTWNEPYGNGYFMKFSAAICYGGTDPIRLVLNGESTVVHTGTSDKADSCGIYTNGSIEILDGSAEGIGSLTANGGPTEYTSSYSYGVYARGCSITVTSGSLTAIGGTAKYGSSAGMYAHNGSIEVTGGSLTGIGGEANSSSTGVWADKDIVISGSGAVVATGGDSGEYSRGVATYSSIQVTGGSLNATCGMGLDSGGYALYAKVLTMGTGYGIVTPVGGKFDAEQRNVVDADGNPAKEVKIAEKPVTYYDLWVGGEQVTSEKPTISGTTGTATYDPGTNTLTLNNYSYTGEGYEVYGAAIYYGSGGTLKLVLVNDNSITHTDATYTSSGIYVDNGSITISGSGSLTVTADDTPSGQSVSYGIFVSGGNLTILGGTVTATGGKASGGYSADSCGICVQGTITISGGTVTATGGEVSDGETAGCRSYGLYAYGEIHISGGTVTAASGTVNGEYSADSNGVFPYGGLTLGEGIGILTPAGGKFDAEQRAVVDADGNIATEVKIAEMPDPVKVQLKLTKAFNGWGKAESFTFNLAAVTENAPMPASPSATATESAPLAYFGEITFTATGIYEYTITEVDSGIPGVTYDTSAHKVVVTITENAESNTLVSEVEYDGGSSLIITNTYAEATPYDLWVGGAQFTSEKLTITDENGGTATYDPETNTLKLNNYSCESDYTWRDAGLRGAVIRYDGTETLNLELNGKNTVTHTDVSMPGEQVDIYGVFAPNGGIEISGTGSLTATGGTATTEGDSCGIFCANNLKISSGKVIAVGNTAVKGDSYGIFAVEGVTITGGTVEATGGEADHASRGIWANYDGITISGGTVKATGGTGNYSYGIYVENDDITISGGTVEATGATANVCSYGVYAAWGITVSGSLTAVSGAAGEQSCGIAADSWDNGHITINGGTVEATGGNASSSYGIFVREYPTQSAAGTIIINGGETIAKGNTSAFNVEPVIGNALAVYDADDQVIASPFWTGEGALTYAKIAEKPLIRHDLWVGGTQVTSHNAADVFGDGKVSYDATTNTLTLNGYTYEGAGHTWEDGFGSSCGAAIYYGDTEPLNLILKGDSTVTHTGNENLYRSYGLYANGNVVVNADSLDDSLTITGGAATYGSYGVCLAYDYDNSVGGELTLNSGSLIATGGEVSRDYYISYGLRIERSTVINGGSIIAKAKEQTNKTVKRSGMVYGESITFAGGFGILTPVGGKISYGDILDSSDEVADYVEIGAGYTVTAAFDSVDEKNVGGTVSGAGFYAEGAEVTLTITPDTGCELKSVTAVSDGSTVNGTLSGSTYTFTMPENDVAITVTMERLFTPYDLWVGGVQFTDKNPTISDGKGGTATYDYASNTLTLDGYTYEGAGHTWEEAGWGGTPIYYGAAIYYSGTETLHLVRKGDSSVTHTGSADMSVSYGLYAKGNVVVNADSLDDSLTITGGAANESHGVYAGGSITLSDGSLTATGGTAENDSYGVCANGSIEVSGSLTATGGTAEYRSYGVHATGSITVPGSLTATGGTSGGDSYGVYANGSITVSGSLHATGGTSGYNSYGVSISGLTMGEGIGILTPVGGYFDNNWFAVVDADGDVATEVKIGIACDHSGNENQHTDCTVDLICSVCGEVVTEAAAAHIPGEDDGDCTTAIKCTVCGTVTTPAKEKHTPEADDGDCTTAVKCTACDKNAVEAKTHSDGEDDNHACDNSGCTVDNVDGGHHGGTATCKEKAVCAECGQSYGDLGDHDYGTLIPAQAEVHTQTDLKAGVAAHYFCDVCDTYFTEDKVKTTLEALTGDAPEHSYGNWITTDADNHWKACSCGLKAEIGAHVYDGDRDATCNTCGHERVLAHEHTFADTLSYDANNH